VKADKPAAALTLSTCVHLCRSFAILGAPFIPFTGRQIYANLALDATPETALWSAIEDWSSLTAHTVAPKPVPLFKKIEDSQVAALQERFAGSSGE